VLFDLGRLEDAAATLTSAVQSASAVGNHDLALAARQSLGIVQLQMDADFDLELLEREARAAVDAGLDGGGGVGLVRAGHTLVVVDVNRAHFADMYESAARLVEWAEAVDDRVSADLGRRWMVSAWTFGPSPAAEAAEACELLVSHHLVGGAAAFSNVLVGLLRAMAGDLEGGRRLMEEMMDVERELGLAFDLAVASLSRGMLERYAGDLETAARVLQEGCTALEEMHETGYLSTVSGMLGVVLAETGRIDEAERAARRARDAAAPQDVVAQSLWRQGQALVEAARTNLAEGERLAREADAILAPSDALEFQADVLVALGGILALSARCEEAAEALRQALDRFERKGHVPGTARARALLDRLPAAPLRLG
jgi:tetratricopeptide (TPR) repeat protein